MRSYALDFLNDETALGLPGDDAPARRSVLLDGTGPSALSQPAVPEGDEAAPAPLDTPETGSPSVLLSDDEDPLTASAAIASDDPPVASAPSAQDVDPMQILRDRPDVFAAFYSEYYGPNNDRHSHAWIDRVGGATPEDYARYWYKTYGLVSGYVPSSSGSSGAPLEGAESSSVGRTTIDGIALSKILSDRPDVFQAFFTEYYGPNNDRHSDAWVQRVGGATVEDYANYWYNAHGKVSGYTPSGTPVASLPDSENTDGASLPASVDPGGGVPDPLPTDDLVQPPGLGESVTLWSLLGADLARPLIYHPTDQGFELLPATDEELIQLQAKTLFDEGII